MARTHVILGDDVVAAIDRLVGARGRSRFLDEAAREKLDRVAVDRAMNVTVGILGEDYPEFADQGDINDWVRAARRTEVAS